jgi:hypothetical protein
LAPRAKGRRLRFRIEEPGAGFGSTLDAINAWHRYSKNKQVRIRAQYVGQQKFCRWCFKTLESAERFKQRFGGEVVPASISRTQPRSDDTSLSSEATVSTTNERLIQA